MCDQREVERIGYMDMTGYKNVFYGKCVVPSAAREAHQG